MRIKGTEFVRSDEATTVQSPSASQFLWFFSTLTLLSITPFWTVRYPLLCDYPNHLARWFVLSHWRDPHYNFSELYAPSWAPLPYITPDLLAVALQHIFPIDIVGRCILSLCIISVAFAGFLFLRWTCPENSSLALLGIALAFNPMFLLGSVSYELSIAFCLLTVGFWVSYCSSRSLGKAVIVLLGLLLTYFTHLIGILVAGLVMGVYALFQQSRWKKLGALAILSAPTLAVMGYTLWNCGGAAAGHFVFADLTVWNKLKNLFFPLRLFTSWIVDGLVLTVVAVLIVLLIRAQEGLRIRPVWIAVCACLLLAYTVAPTTWGNGGYADCRITPFLWFFAIPILQFKRFPRWVLVLLTALVIFRIATVEQLFVNNQSQLQQMTAAFEAIPRNAKVLQMGVADVGTPGNARHGGLLAGRGPTYHLFYGVIERGILAPQLYHLPGVQPVRLSGAVYCPNVLCNIENPTDAEWGNIALSYDYIWVEKNWVFSPPPSRFADVIFSNGSVAVYRLKHQP